MWTPAHQTQHDLVVAGNGCVGWAAAVVAARRGRRVLLLGRRPQPGWELTAAWDATLLSGEFSGLAREVLERLAAIGARRDGRVCVPAAECLLTRMAEEAGVRLVWYVTPLGAACLDGMATAVYAAGKTGETTFPARGIVDATEEAVIARALGFPMVSTGPGSARFTVVLHGLSQPLTAPEVLGDRGAARRITVHPAMWPDEALLTYDILGSDPVTGGLAVADALAALREAGGPASTAIVTFWSGEPRLSDVPYAQDPHRSVPDVGSVWLGGPAVIADGRKRQASMTWPVLLSLGERVGEEAADRLAEAGSAQPTAGASSLASLPTEKVQADVIVAGGGTSGALAAVAAAREGARTLLVEPLPFLGGIGSGGGIHCYFHGVTGGLQDELDARVAELQPLFLGAHAVDGYHPEARKLALLRLAQEAGVHLLFSATVCGAETEPLSGDRLRRPSSAVIPNAGEMPSRRLARVRLACGDGRLRLGESPVFVDATGDGDLAAMAGVPFRMGREKDGLLHVYTQSAGCLTREKDRSVMRIVNFDAGYVDVDDVEDLTRARRAGLAHLARALEPAWTAERRWTYIAPQLGIRQGRQIEGDYTLTLGDQIVGRTFPDAIAYAWAFYDLHVADMENESDAGALWVWLFGQRRTMIGCEVPYRCLLPRSVEGLLVACRAISVTQDAHYLLRMQRDLQAIGEAAGVAAALAARAGIPPRQVDVSRVRTILQRRGALKPEARPQPTFSLSALPELPPPVSDDCQHVWNLVTQAAGPNTTAQLLPDAGSAFWPAAARAMAGNPSGAAALVEAVVRRQPATAPGQHAAPVWVSAVILLGRLRERSSVPVLCDVIRDASLKPSARLAALRALGRIGDAQAAEAIRSWVESGEEIDRPLASATFSGGQRIAVRENLRWHLMLTAAEALGRMGLARRDWVDPWLEDERAYVRRYARRVLAILPPEASRG